MVSMMYNIKTNMTNHMVNLLAISEDRIIRYGSLVCATIYPGMAIILMTNSQIFFNLEISRIMLLSIFYSVR
jgi:hypothetical protein